MPGKRRIIVVDLDEQSRSVVEKCLPTNHFGIVEFNAEEKPPQQADLVIFGGGSDLTKTEGVCTVLRTHVGNNAPLLACVNKYAFPILRPLLGNVIQGLLIAPLDEDDLRRELDKLELGF